MPQKVSEAAARSGYWENLRKKRLRDQHEKGTLTEKAYRDLFFGRLAGAAGLGGDIAELLSPPLLSGGQALKFKGQKPPAPELTEKEDQYALKLGRAFPRDGSGLKQKYTSPYFAEKWNVPYAEFLLGDALGPGAPVGAGVRGSQALVSAMANIDLTGIPLAGLAGIFASNRAKNLPKKSLDRFLELEKKGELNQEGLFRETGFWRGPEGEIRFEISDKDIKIKPEALKTAYEILGYKDPGFGDRTHTEIGWGLMEDVVDHPELFEAYPELRKITVKFDPEGEMGSGGKAGGYYSRRGEAAPSQDWGSTPYASPVIMLAAPTRQSEMKRLEGVISNTKDEINRLVEWQFKDPDSFREQSFDIVDLEKILVKFEAQLKRLQAGGQVDISEGIKSTLTHELQHAVQDIENLPRGGSWTIAEKLSREAITKGIPAKAGKKRDVIIQSVVEQNKLYGELHALDTVLELQQLQRYIASDNPTRNARFINGNAIRYGLKGEDANFQWTKPKRWKKQEYGSWLRGMARIYMKEIVRRYGTSGQYSNEGKFRTALSNLAKYERKKGNPFPENFPGKWLNKDEYKRESSQEWADSPYSPLGMDNPDLPETSEISESFEVPGRFKPQPNWLDIPEKSLKNAKARIGRKIDNLREDADLERKIERKLFELDERKEKFDSRGWAGSAREFYYRLAGEAEARAVENRYRQALHGVEAGTGSPDDILRTLPTKQGWTRPYYSDLGPDPGGAYDVPLRELSMIYDQYPSSAVAAAAARNVPTSEMGFYSPALKVAMDSPKEEMPKEMWLKYLRGNGVKDAELEFSGLEQWLKDQKGQISKAQVEEYMNTSNKLKIEEVVYGGKTHEKLRDLYVQDQHEKFGIIQIKDDYDDILPEVFQPHSGSDYDPEKWFIVDENGEVLTTHAGSPKVYDTWDEADEDLVEILYEESDEFSHQELLDFNYPGQSDPTDYYGPVKYDADDLQVPGGENYRELVLYWDTQGPKWTGQHSYTDVDNPLMHIRFNERIIPGAGQKYTVDPPYKMEIIPHGDPHLKKFLAHYSDDLPQRFFTRKVGSDTHDQSFRRLEDAQESVDNWNIQEYKKDEKILFIEEIQSDQAKMGEAKGWKGNLPKGYSIKTHAEGGFVLENPEGVGTRIRQPDILGLGAGDIVKTKEEAYQIAAKKFDPEERAPFLMDTKDYVELGLKRMILWASENGFDRIAWTTGKQQAKRYLREEDPKHFLSVMYDKIIKQVAEKLGKKFGGKVEQVSIPQSKEKNWSINLSEKLKKAAKDGLPYMALAPGAMMIPTEEKQKDFTNLSRASARPVTTNYTNSTNQSP